MRKKNTNYIYNNKVSKNVIIILFLVGLDIIYTGKHWEPITISQNKLTTIDRSMAVTIQTIFYRDCTTQCTFIS